MTAKKTLIPVEAIKYTGSNHAEIIDKFKGDLPKKTKDIYFIVDLGKNKLEVKTPDGLCLVRKGNWVCQDPKKPTHFWVVTNKNFGVYYRVMDK